MKELLFVLSEILYMVYSNPCEEFIHLKNLDSRRTNYAVDSSNGEVEICDKFDIPSDGAWYYTTEAMPRTPPDLSTCGTTFPIWMNGNLPTAEEGIVTRQACTKTAFDDCQHQYDIQVKKCEGYWTYFLVPTQTCPEAYCFGDGINDIPPDYVPQSISVQTKLVGYRGVTDTLEFNCEFDQSADDPNLFYKVVWIADGNRIPDPPVVKANELEKTKLDEFSGYLQLGKTYECAVRTRYDIKGKSGPIKKSSGFFAGVTVTNNVINLQRNTQQTTHITLTVPFGCIWKNGAPTKDCTMPLRMSVPQNINSGQCTSQPGLVGEADRCLIIIPAKTWSDNHEITLAYMDDFSYNVPKSSFALILEFESLVHPKSWNGFRLPEIMVNVHDTNAGWKGKTCKVQNDPHMTTFDHRMHENHNSGRFILYENIAETRPMQVQIEVFQCWPGIYCTCGAAIRAGGDIFKVDFCNGNSIMQFITCHDKILDVRRQSGNEQNYNIRLPTGTEVDILVYGHQINVYVRASVHDWEKTRGLCGFLSDDCKDDFRHRNGFVEPDNKNCQNSKTYYDEYPNAFSRSWRVEPNDTDLFTIKENENIDLWDDEKRYCTCPATEGSSNIFSCHPSAVLECDREVFYDPVGAETCNSQLKKSLAYPWKSFQKRRKKRSATLPLVSTPVNMTEAEARKYCEDYFSKSESAQLCADIPNVFNDDAIETCVLDIVLTGSLDWLTQSLDMAKSSCFGEIRKNQTLQEETTENGTSIVDTILNTICPGVPTCSDKGVCVNATCVCNSGYMAPDCSVEITEPPDVYGIRGEGICDKNEIPCSTAYLLGDVIYRSANLSCRMSKFQLSPEGQVEDNIATSVTSAHLETLIEMHCSLPRDTREKREISTKKTDSDIFVEGYKISVSYDGINFGEPLSFFRYDSRCQEHSYDNSSETSTFTLKEGYCFIDGGCVSQGTRSNSNPCYICVVSTYKYGWTHDDTNEDCMPIKDIIKEEMTESYLWIIGVVIPTVLIPMVVAVVYWCHKKSKRGKQISDSQEFNTFQETSRKG